MNHQVPSCMQNPANQSNQSDFYPNQQRIPNQNFCHYPTQSPAQVAAFNTSQQMDVNPPVQRLNILEQIRSCFDNTTPIFILPNNCIGIPAPQTSSFTQNTYPSPPLPQPSLAPVYYGPPPPPLPSTYLPYPLPIPVCSMTRQEELKTNFQPMGQFQQQSCGNYHNAQLPKEPTNVDPESVECHKCCPSDNGAICKKTNCPAAIRLQALVSQLLSIQGTMSCTVTRILLKRIPGSNILNTDEEIMERAQKTFDAMTKDQLLAESRSCLQLNALINLYMTSKPPNNVLPILTMAQLKMNSLKARVEKIICEKENDGFVAESRELLDPQALSLKSDAELREFMIYLKHRESQERMNLSLATYNVQRGVVESKLNCIRRKIVQLEEEFMRRQTWTSKVSRTAVSAQTSMNFRCESSDPFPIQSRNPKRLNLKPHVGSSETTYQRPQDIGSSPSTSQERDGGQCSNDNAMENKRKNAEDDSKLVFNFVVLMNEESEKDEDKEDKDKDEQGTMSDEKKMAPEENHQMTVEKEEDEDEEETKKNV